MSYLKKNEKIAIYTIFNDVFLTMKVIHLDQLSLTGLACLLDSSV